MGVPEIAAKAGRSLPLLEALLRKRGFLVEFSTPHTCLSLLLREQRKGTGREGSSERWCRPRPSPTGVPGSAQ